MCVCGVDESSAAACIHAQLCAKRYVLLTRQIQRTNFVCTDDGMEEEWTHPQQHLHKCLLID